MKLSSLFLAASLVANVALIVVLVRQPSDAAAPSDLAAKSASLSTHSSAASSSTAGSAAKKSATPGSSLAPQKWNALNTDDLKALVPRLRAAGFPPTVIRRIVMALVSERFDARRLEIEKANLEAPFWTNTPNSFNDPKIGPELRKLQREQTELLQSVLGGTIADVYADTEDAKAMMRQQVGDIGPDKIDKLYSTAMDWSEKRAAIYAALGTNGMMLDADRQKIVAIEKAMRDDLGKFLTPTEVSDFMLRGSETSYRLRYSLTAMQPSEQEYRTIFPVYQAFQDQFPSGVMQGANAPQSDERRVAEEQMNNQIKALLGPDRAADFQQAMNPNYNQLNRLVARLDLPISAATQVAAVQQDIQDRATAVRSDTTLAPADRKAQLAALAQEATTKVTATLGASGAEAYKQYGGQWLQNLTPRPAAAKK